MGVGGTATNNPKLGSAASTGAAKTSPATNSTGGAPDLSTITASLLPGLSGAAFEQEGDVTGLVNYNMHSSLFYTESNSKLPIRPNPAFEKICANDDVASTAVNDFSVLATTLDHSSPNSIRPTDDDTGFEAWLRRMLEPLDGGYLAIQGEEQHAPEEVATELRAATVDEAKKRAARDAAQSNVDHLPPKGVNVLDEHRNALIARLNIANSDLFAAAAKKKAAQKKATDKSSGAGSSIMSYTTHLNISWNGGGSVTWTPAGMAPHFTGIGPAASDKYMDDVELAITFAPDTGTPDGKPTKQGLDAVRSQANLQQVLMTFRAR